jgi:hypothetical protein
VSAPALRQKVKHAAKARKRELVKEDRDYSRKVEEQMRDECVDFELIPQPIVERGSSRLTARRSIDEATKRAYLRPYARGRLHPLVVARESGLTLLQSQYTTAVEQQHRGRLSGLTDNKSGFYGKRVYYEKSMIQGWGLFALEPISAESLVCEYVGDLVRSRVADKREVRYKELGLPHMYFFRMTDLIVDATMRGGSARFLNHSCHPNCRSRIIQFGNNEIISFSAMRNIKAHEELTFNYKMEFETDRRKGERCFCGAKQCIGWLNYKENKGQGTEQFEDELRSSDSD